jgi:hypothetical protein
VNPQLALALLVAASLHFVLLGDHAAESPALAAGFLAAGLGQLALATLVAVQPSKLVYLAAIVLDVSLILLYVGHVLVGIPLPTGIGFELEFSSREDPDIGGISTVIAELAAVALAYAGLLGKPRPQTAAD